MSATKSSHWPHRIANLGWVVLIVAADQLSKLYVFRWLETLGPELDRGCHAGAHPRQLVAGEWLAFQLNLNYGAAWGMFEEHPWLLVLGRCGAVLLLAWLAFFGSGIGRWTRIALLLILGGALGNLLDNLSLQGASGRTFGPVRDFIDFYVPAWEWHFQTFNVADAHISVGAVLLLASGFLSRHRSEPQALTDRT